MLCGRCETFIGNPCACCRTHSRIGWLLTDCKLAPVQELAALAALRECCGIIQDLAETKPGRVIIPPDYPKEEHPSEPATGAASDKAEEEIAKDKRLPLKETRVEPKREEDGGEKSKQPKTGDKKSSEKKKTKKRKHTGSEDERKSPSPRHKGKAKKVKDEEPSTGPDPESGAAVPEDLQNQIDSYAELYTRPRLSWALSRSGAVQHERRGRSTVADRQSQATPRQDSRGAVIGTRRSPGGDLRRRGRGTKDASTGCGGKLTVPVNTGTNGSQSQSQSQSGRRGKGQSESQGQSRPPGHGKSKGPGEGKRARCPTTSSSSTSRSSPRQHSGPVGTRARSRSLKAFPLVPERGDQTGDGRRHVLSPGVQGLSRDQRDRGQGRGGDPESSVAGHHPRGSAQAALWPARSPLPFALVSHRLQPGGCGGHFAAHTEVEEDGRPRQGGWLGSQSSEGGPCRGYRRASGVEDPRAGALESGTSGGRGPLYSARRGKEDEEKEEEKRGERLKEEEKRGCRENIGIPHLGGQVRRDQIQSGCQEEPCGPVLRDRPGYQRTGAPSCIQTGPSGTTQEEQEGQFRQLRRDHVFIGEFASRRGRRGCLSAEFESEEAGFRRVSRGPGGTGPVTNADQPSGRAGDRGGLREVTPLCSGLLQATAGPQGGRTGSERAADASGSSWPLASRQRGFCHGHHVAAVQVVRKHATGQSLVGIPAPGGCAPRGSFTHTSTRDGTGAQGRLPGGQNEVADSPARWTAVVNQQQLQGAIEGQGRDQGCPQGRQRSEVGQRRPWKDRSQQKKEQGANKA